MDFHHRRPRHGHSQALIEASLSDDLIDDVRPASLPIPMSMSHSHCMPPTEDNLLFHNLPSSGELAAPASSNHHFLVSSPVATPLSPLTQEPDDWSLHSTNVTNRFKGDVHTPGNAAVRKKNQRAEAKKQKRRDEKSMLTAKLESLTQEVKTLEAERSRLLQNTLRLEQTIESRMEAATQQVSPATDTDACNGICS